VLASRFGNENSAAALSVQRSAIRLAIGAPLAASVGLEFSWTEGGNVQFALCQLAAGRLGG
jgi:hypothetical protein